MWAKWLALDQALASLLSVWLPLVILLQATEVSSSITLPLPSCVWGQVTLPLWASAFAHLFKKSINKTTLTWAATKQQWLKWGHAVKLIVSIKCYLHGGTWTFLRSMRKERRGELPNTCPMSPPAASTPDYSLQSLCSPENVLAGYTPKQSPVASGKEKKGLHWSC